MIDCPLFYFPSIVFDKITLLCYYINTTKGTVPSVSLIMSKKEVRMMGKMEEKRRNEILLAAKKAELRKEFSLRHIASIKRKVGNLVKEPEMVAIHATPEELLELATSLVEEVFMEQMNKVKK